jgi:hypothetical protein
MSVSALEPDFAGMKVDFAGMYAGLDNIGRRLDRVERRLDLIDEPTAQQVPGEVVVRSGGVERDGRIMIPADGDQ